MPIVEGEGDEAAVPVLLRRMALRLGAADVVVLRPHRRGDLTKIRPRLEDFVRAALKEHAPILWVLDYDCAACRNLDADLAELNHRAKAIAKGHPIEFALIAKEFESLFLSEEQAARRVLRHIPATLEFPLDPESIRDAKGWLSQALPKGLAYKPTQHQPRIADAVDLDVLASRSPSYKRLEAAMARLIGTYTP